MNETLPSASAPLLIPHRFPMAWVDQVVSFDKGKRIRGIKNISANERLPFAGNGLLLCESLAQLSKLLEVLSEDDPRGQGVQDLSYLASVDVKLHLAPKVGDCVLLEAQAGTALGEMRSYTVSAQVEGRALLTGRLFRKVKVA